MKVGLLGGSFNPPHKGHIHISNLAIKKLDLDQIWWLPTKHNPLKEISIYADYQKRFLDCLLLTNSHPKIHIKKFDEIYTYDLISRLKRKYKNIDFIWLMGADNLTNLHRWKNYKKLIKEIPLAVFSRNTDLRKKTRISKLLQKSSCKIFHTKNCDISSTQIRNKNG